MTKNLTKWTSEHGQTAKIRPSDGCRGIQLPLAVPIRYDCHGHGFEDYLGNVGIHRTNSGPRSPPTAICVTIIGNWGEPSGESWINAAVVYDDVPVGGSGGHGWSRVWRNAILR